MKIWRNKTFFLPLSATRSTCFLWLLGECATAELHPHPLQHFIWLWDRISLGCPGWPWPCRPATWAPRVAGLLGVAHPRQLSLFSLPLPPLLLTLKSEFRFHRPGAFRALSECLTLQDYRLILHPLTANQTPYTKSWLERWNPPRGIQLTAQCSAQRSWTYSIWYGVKRWRSSCRIEAAPSMWNSVMTLHLGTWPLDCV